MPRNAEFKTAVYAAVDNLVIALQWGVVTWPKDRESAIEGLLKIFEGAESMVESAGATSDDPEYQRMVKLITGVIGG